MLFRLLSSAEPVTSQCRGSTIGALNALRNSLTELFYNELSRLDCKQFPDTLHSTGTHWLGDTWWWKAIVLLGFVSDYPIGVAFWGLGRKLTAIINKDFNLHLPTCNLRRLRKRQAALASTSTLASRRRDVDVSCNRYFVNAAADAE